MRRPPVAPASCLRFSSISSHMLEPQHAAPLIRKIAPLAARWVPHPCFKGAGLDEAPPTSQRRPSPALLAVITSLRTHPPPPPTTATPTAWLSNSRLPRRSACRPTTSPATPSSPLLAPMHHRRPAMRIPTRHPRRLCFTVRLIATRNDLRHTSPHMRLPAASHSNSSHIPRRMFAF